MAACLHRSAGLDAMNALYSTAFETDKKYGTRYFDNLRSFLAHVQGGDLTVDGAVADPKEPASESESSEIRLRVVERKPGGVVVRGAKMQNVGVCASHEIIAIPSGAVKEADKAIAFAVPTDAEGIMIIIGSQSDGGARPGDGFYGETGPFVVFDDVFVPNERIFLNGETEFTETLADRFAAFHRQSCSGSKSGIGDVLIGAIALAAQFNGSDKRFLCPQQPSGNDPSQRNDILLRRGLLGYGRGNGGRRMLHRPAADKRVPAERDPFPPTR